LEFCTALETHFFVAAEQFRVVLQLIEEHYNKASYIDINTAS